jgi:N-acetyl-gamma-glutamyl-phosphate reductase
MPRPVAVLGASGYAGGELVRLLDEHPQFEIAHLGAHTHAGEKLTEIHPHLRAGDRVLGTNDPETLPEVAAAFLALPHGASAAIASTLAKRNIRVLDLGSDLRLDTPERYEFAYGSPHPLPEELTAWVYGLPELFGSEIVGAARVAVPGCYPTGALLALVPLLAAGLITDEGIVVDAASGVSGAGRALRDDLLFGAVAEGVRAYAVGVHRHRPEIEMGLEQAVGRPIRLTFTPHLVPMQRGILTTVTAPLAADSDRETLLHTLAEAYRDAPFVHVIEQSPQTRWVTGSNQAAVTAFVDEHARTAVVLSAIDNLVKGAAGQAVQCANLMFGLEETTGLPLSGLLP